MKNPYNVPVILFLGALLLIGFTRIEVTSQSSETTPFPTQRDPIYWPFAADSIWNVPIHNDAVYVESGLDRHMPLEAGPTTDQEILILSSGSPRVPVQESFAGFDGLDRCGIANLTGAALFEAPIPNTWSTGGGSEGNMSGAILLEDGDTIVETQPLHVCSQGGLVTSAWVWDPKSIRTSDGIAGSHGGSGLSSLGGSIRYNELLPGSVIRHALKMNFYARYAYSYTGDTPGYRWPALQADGYASPETYGGTVAEMVLGSLLALDPSFDIAGLQTEPARIIARAAQDYGIYAVDDTAWDVFGLAVEWGTVGSGNRSVIDQFQETYGYGFDDGPLLNCTESTDACKFSQDMWTIISHLRVIDNNTATTIGGGPNSDTVNRRAPMPPPFMPPPTPTPGPSPTPRPTATITPPPTITPTFAPGEWIPVDDTDPNWTYSGWEAYRDARAYGRTAHGSAEVGAYGEYTFTGTGVEVYTWKGSDGGSVEVFIDGISQGVYSLYAVADQYDQLLFSTTDLQDGTHTVRIVAVEGEWCMVDYIRHK